MNTTNTVFLPDFLIIGAGKSGTTTLEHYLKQHPEIFLPEVKEPNFFAYEMHTENDFEDKDTKEHYRQSRRLEKFLIRICVYHLPWKGLNIMCHM